LACLLFFTVKEIFNKKIALLASFMWMTYPFNLWFIKSPNSEVPFLPFLYLGIFLLILSLKRDNLKIIFLSGFALGISFLIRLPAIFFAAFLSFLIFFLLKKISFKRKFLLAVILLAGNFFAILPWGIYSFSNNGGFIPVSSLASAGFSEGFTFLLGTDRRGIPLSKETREALAELKERPQSGNGNKALIEAFKNKPAIFLKLTWLRMARAWYATGMMWWENVIIAIQIFYLSLALSGIFYAYKRYREKINYLILLFGIIIYFWAMSFLTIPILRYVIPVMPLVIVFSAVFLDSLMSKFNLYGKIGFNNNSLQK
jgi:4-amino-4-deoxy-L-arabinose transferase-like glycosyltransferase